MKYFVTGIGTDVGKSWATGWLARKWMDEGKSVITQKFVQTGNDTDSEDIDVHRRVMGMDYTTEDKLHITAPEIFSYPCSPDLAAKIDGRELDLGLIDQASETLEKRYGDVLIEGAGGVMVPLKGEYLTIDYIRDRKLRAIVVTNGQLGSINHTLLTLEALLHEGIVLEGVIYNSHFDKDKTICDDTKQYLAKYLERKFPTTWLLEMPSIKL